MSTEPEVKKQWAVCTCEWDEGSYYEPPTPKEICEYCIGGMEQSMRIARSMNRSRMALPDNERQAIRRVMESAGLHPYSGLTAEQQKREVQEVLDERVKEDT